MPLPNRYNKSDTITADSVLEIHANDAAILPIRQFPVIKIYYLYFLERRS